MAPLLTMVFWDGFDAYTSPNGARKWTSGTAINTTTTGTRNNVGRCWTIGAASHQLGTNYRSGQIAVPVRWLQAGQGRMIEVLDNTGAAQLTLNFEGGNVLQLRRGSSIGTILATSVIPRFLAIWDYLEFAYHIDSAAGSYRIVVNGAVDLNATGVNTQATALNTWSGFGGDTDPCAFDDWITKAGNAGYHNTDDFWMDKRVSTLFPNGVGDVTQWLQVPVGGPTGSNNYEKVDDTLADDDTTYNASDVVGATDLYQFQDLMAGATDIRGVQLNVVAKRENSGTPATRTMQPIIRSNGVDSLAAAVTLGNSYVNYRHPLLLDPSGGAAFTKARVDAIQGGQVLAS